MANIGEEQREIEVIPLSEPVPALPDREDSPVPITPDRELEPV